jgi:hypothetical protein
MPPTAPGGDGSGRYLRLCGRRFSGSVYVGSTVDWGIKFGTLPDRPAFQTYATRLRQRPAHARVFPDKPLGS